MAKVVVKEFQAQNSGARFALLTLLCSLALASGILPQRPQYCQQRRPEVREMHIKSQQPTLQSLPILSESQQVYYHHRKKDERQHSSLQT